MSPVSESTTFDPRLTHGEAWKTLFRVTTYLRYFKARVAAKVVLVNAEIAFRIMLLPWVLKIIVDHVILNQPVPADAAGFPGYVAPLVIPLHNMPATQIMAWMLLAGVVIVILFGMTPNRATGVTAAGALTGVREGSAGEAGADLANGEDTATQTENSANGASSNMGGIFGMLDFLINLRLSQSMNHLLRTQLADHITSLPMSTLEEHRIGDNAYRVLYDSTGANGIFEGLVVHLLPGILMIAITMGVLRTSFGDASELILVAFLVGVFAYFLVAPLTGVVRRRSQASRAAGSKMTTNIEEGMSNVLAVQTLGGNEQERERFSNASSDSFKQYRSQVIAQLAMGMMGNLAFLSGQVAFFVIMAGYVINGTFTAGDYFVVNYYFFVLSAVCFGFGTVYSELQPDVAGVARVFRILDMKPEVTGDGIDLPEIRHGLVMSDVGLTYPDGRRALKNVNLEARLGEIIAIVGPAGAGKTTLAYLVPALLQASEGSVSIDGVDLKTVSARSLREQVSYVFQETQLFSDSILENIRYGNSDASLADVEAVARTAGAHDFIAALPDGYHTNLGTVTSKLSVGQKQRIAIARGLLKKSRILVLDEPTSALDPETEEYLVDALHDAAKEKLVIVIAHRLSTISHADRIYFLDGGEIIESGTPQELMKMPQGRFRHFVELQTSSR
ncbi:MAG: ABC transporter ATP-binding protein [Pseudomonadota bacterium]